MSGVPENGRRLRPRSGNFAVTAADDMRRTRAAAKRAAMEDSTRPSGTALVQHAKKRAVQQSKKRAALANLSNQSNVPAVQSAVPVVSRGCAPAHNADCMTLRSGPIPSEGDENAPPCGKEVGAQAKAVKVISEPQERSEVSNAAAIASLERRTVQNLYISRDSKTRAKQGGLFDENLPPEKTGWSSRLHFHDIDNDHSDPQMCSMYATDIYQHLRITEIKRRPTTNFMEVLQQDINCSMRGILVDWLVEVAEEYKLVPDTLYLTISYIDRFLSCNIVTRQRLQLLGVSCMLIAAKYEEICAPQVEEFCYITDNTYCRDEVLEMERRVLNDLKFELTTPTTKSFLRRFVRAAQAGYKVPTLNLEFLGNYLAELTLVEYSLLHYLPSLIAASAVFMAKLTLDSKLCPWDSTLQHYTGYQPSDLKDCVKAIYDLQCNTKSCTLPAIREKYRQHKFKCVSSLAPPALLPLEYFHDLE